MFWSISRIWSSLVAWDAIEIASLIVVIVGVGGEYIADIFKVPKDRTRRRQTMAWAGAILLIGLAVELMATGRTVILSGKQIASLNKASSDAARDVALANKDAANATSRVAEAEGRVAIAEKEEALAKLDIAVAAKAAADANLRAEEASRDSALASQRAADANKQAAESNEKAALAEKAAEDERIARIALVAKLSDWSLSSKQMDELLGVAQRFPGQRIDIFVSGSFNTDFLLVEELYAPLNAARWSANIWSCRSSPFALNKIRLSSARGADKANRDAAAALLSILNEKREFNVFPDPEFDSVLPITEIKPYWGFGNEWKDQNEAPIRIVIGTKLNGVIADDKDFEKVIDKLTNDLMTSTANMTADLKQWQSQTKPSASNTKLPSQRPTGKGIR